MVSKFERKLPDSGLALLEAGPAWWRDLLDFRFTDIGGKEQPLFLAVRDGYLNAYVEGQSVLKIHLTAQFDPTQLKAEIHHKYIDSNVTGQAYHIFDGERVTDRSGREIEQYQGRKSIKRWVEAAQSYAKPKRPGRIGEKQGIAAILGHNAHVIDVEMALPQAQSSADRIDIVALEKDDETLKIVFYEAKAFSNRSLRAANLFPKVLAQLERYENWIVSADRVGQIIPAYRETCRLLIKFNEMRYANTDRPVPPVHPFVAQAAEKGSILEVDPEPRLIVFGYRPDERGGSWRRHEEVFYREKVRLIMEPRPQDVRLPQVNLPRMISDDEDILWTVEGPEAANEVRAAARRNFLSDRQRRRDESASGVLQAGRVSDQA